MTRSQVFTGSRQQPFQREGARDTGGPCPYAELRSNMSQFSALRPFGIVGVHSPQTCRVLPALAEMQPHLLECLWQSTRYRFRSHACDDPGDYASPAEEQDWGPRWTEVLRLTTMNCWWKREIADQLPLTRCINRNANKPQPRLNATFDGRCMLEAPSCFNSAST